MKNVYIEFDGYCPESKLKGEVVEMKLNDMDFWESEKTGLQITIFPPYAAILQWRGEGKFRKTKAVASKNQNNIGLLLTKSQSQSGCELFPDEKQVFDDSSDLADFIDSIDSSYLEFTQKAISK